MRRLNVFLDQHKYRLSATFFVSLIYVYFWFNGPLEEVELISLGAHETRFLVPKLISDQTDAGQDSYGILQDREELPWFVRLVGYKNEPPPTWNLIADAHHNPALNRSVSVRLLSHARQHVVDGSAVLKPALDMYYSELLDKSKKVSALFFESEDVVKDVKGYAGPITLGVLIGMDGKISRVQYISSIETASYLTLIDKKKFYQQFTGQSLSDGTLEIDAVSGATISTEAMARTVTELIVKATDSPLSLYMENDSSGYSVRAVLSNIWILHSILLVAFFIFGWQRWFRRSKRILLFSYLLSLGYIGFFLNNSFTYVSFIHPFMGVTVSTMVAIYATLVLIGSIWDNNTYCKYVCPYGNAQRLLLRLFSQFAPGLRKQIILSSRQLSTIRMLLTVILISGIMIGERHWSNYELFPDIFGLDIVSLWFWLSLLIIFISSVFPMLWCRLLCPTGAVLDFISRLVRPKVHKQNSEESKANTVVVNSPTYI